MRPKESKQAHGMGTKGDKMKKKNQLTLEEHMQIADDLAIIDFLMRKIDSKCLSTYNKTSKLYKSIRKWSGHAGLISELKNQLDNEFHRLIDDETWHKLNEDGHGHIYYNLQRRLSHIPTSEVQNVSLPS